MKKLSTRTILSLTCRFIFILFYSASLGSITYTTLDLILTTFYLSTTAFILFYPPTYNFLISTLDNT